MEEGKKYYIIAHAYYHYVGEVAKVIGPKTVELRNVVQIHSCRRTWTKFFQDGFQDDTSFDKLPDGTTVTAAISYFPWPHISPIKKD